jgi:hypothetical protein
LPQYPLRSQSVNAKLLGLQIYNHLNWKNHIDQLVPKLSTACYAVRPISYISNTGIQINLFSYFHSLIKYGIIFWGNSADRKKVFTLQKNMLESGWIYYTGIKIFNNLTSSLNSLMNEKVQFKVALKRYLTTHSFHSDDEFLMSKNDSSF